MLGDKIKQLRKEYGINQEILAEKLNLSASTIGMYETNKREPNIEIILKLSEIFDVSTDFLLGKTDIKKNKISKEKLTLNILTKNYTSITPTQLEKIEDYAKYILKDNLKN